MYATGVVCLLYCAVNATRGKLMDKKIRWEVEGSRLLSAQAQTYSGAAWRLPFCNDTTHHGGRLGRVMPSCVVISPLILQDWLLRERTEYSRKPHDGGLCGC